MANPSDTSAFYVGLMSGTSMDGVDAALVQFGDHQCDVLDSRQQAYPDSLRHDLRQAILSPEKFTVDKLGSLDHWVAECFASAAQSIIADTNIDRALIRAIGSHGQTVRHQPHSARPFTLQIGDPNKIAALTGLTVVADFRRRDIALGGEGAPLAPAFHQWLLGKNFNSSAVLNIGGIANLTVLADDADKTIGFDTGPGNTLLDAWISENRSRAYDEGGAWAASGTVSQQLLQSLLDDPYIAEAPPKSTGFEYFNLRWLMAAIESCGFSTPLDASDVQATLVEFTARSIAAAVIEHAPSVLNVVVCGGGVHNKFLMSRLDESMRGVSVTSTAASGIDPDSVEAAAFAWLAMRTLHRYPGNLPSVTGAASEAVLGGVFFGTS